MAVTLEQTGNPVFPWRIESLCKSQAEAIAKAVRVEEVNPAAFIPAAVHHAEEAPMPPVIEFEASPELQALIELADEEAPTSHLKAGEAIRQLAEDAE